MAQFEVEFKASRVVNERRMCRIEADNIDAAIDAFNDLTQDEALRMSNKQEEDPQVTFVGDWAILDVTEID